MDSALLDTSASSSARPAGLLANVSALTATSGGGLTALLGDLAKIASAVATAKIPAENLLLVMSPDAAIKARGLLSPNFGYQIIGSNSVASGTIIGLAPSAIAMSIGVPQLESGDGPVIHLDNVATDPVVSGTPATGTVASAFQRQLIVIKVRLRATWATLAPGAVQVINSGISW